MIVGIGGLLSLRSRGTGDLADAILKRMPNLPAALHFFVFDPQALWVHGGLLGATAVIARSTRCTSFRAPADCRNAQG